MGTPTPAAILPDGLGDGLQSHNGFSQATLGTRIDETPIPTPKPEQVPAAHPPADPASPADPEVPAAGHASAKGGGKTEPASVYENGMYWKFPGSIWSSTNSWSDSFFTT